MATTIPGDNLILSQIVEGNPVASIVIDAQHRVTHWNRACAVLTGVPAAEMIGRTEQWRAFYPQPRPIMADLIVSDALEGTVDEFYHGKFRRSALIEGAFEAEDFFPAFGEGGRWLYFTAAPLRNASGELIGAIETLQDVTERHRAEDALRESEERYRLLSVTDPLTGLFNRRHVMQRLEDELARRRRGHPLVAVMIDLDRFKRVNDEAGHAQGDALLAKIGDALARSVRSTDVVGRYGGDEFVVLLPDTDAKQAQIVAERIVVGVREVGARFDARRGVTASVGLAVATTEDDPRRLLARADEAAYVAKSRDGDRVSSEDDVVAVPRASA